MLHPSKRSQGIPETQLTSADNTKYYPPEVSTKDTSTHPPKISHPQSVQTSCPIAGAAGHHAIFIAVDPILDGHDQMAVGGTTYLVGLVRSPIVT